MPDMYKFSPYAKPSHQIQADSLITNEKDLSIFNFPP